MYKAIDWKYLAKSVAVDTEITEGENLKVKDQ